MLCLLHRLMRCRGDSMRTFLRAVNYKHNREVSSRVAAIVRGTVPQDIYLPDRIGRNRFEFPGHRNQCSSAPTSCIFAKYSVRREIKKKLTVVHARVEPRRSEKHQHVARMSVILFFTLRQFTQEGIEPYWPHKRKSDDKNSGAHVQ